MHRALRIRRSALESLEKRRLLAGDVSVVQFDGALSLKGDRADNVISIVGTAVPGQFVISGLPDANGVETDLRFNATRVNQLTISGVSGGIKIDLAGGDDSLLLNDVRALANLSVTMGQGDDSLFSDNSKVTKKFTIEGGAGDNRIEIRGALGAQRLGISTGVGDDQIKLLGAGSGQFARFVTMNTGSGDDKVMVDDVTVGHFFASLGQGKDLFELERHDSASVGATFNSLFHVAGDNGNDIVRIGQAGSSVNQATFNGFSSIRGGQGRDSRSGLSANVFRFRPLVLSFESVESSDQPSDQELSSPGVITVVGVSASSFNSIGASVGFQLAGAAYSANPELVHVYRNGQLVPAASLALSAQTVTAASFLSEGRNDLLLVGVDTNGLSLISAVTIWAGSSMLDVTIVDEAGQLVTDPVSVTARLGDDSGVTTTASTSTGAVTFSHLPNRTLLFTATASNNRLGVMGTTGSAGSVQIKLIGFAPASLIDNNDLSQGTAGWNVGTAPVQIIPHVEQFAALQGAAMVARSSTAEQRSVSSENVATVASTGAAAVAAVDQDLVLNTSGEGEQAISRTFEIKPGTKSVKIRYRFETSEVPGGYFGSQFNDYFRVSIRTATGGESKSEANSMNALGLGAFDAQGATAWREVSLTTNVDGDTVQVDVAVANVADGLFGSRVIVDKIEEQKLEISSLSLYDIDNATLSYLSADDHTYFNGNTRIHGTIAIKGGKEDKLTSLSLEVVQGGAVVATGSLNSSLESALLNKEFGDAGEVKIDASQLLFNLSSAQAALINGAQNGTVSLRVKAISSQGEEATKEYGAVQILVRYDGTNRYGGRDDVVGGDDWVLPSVRTMIAHFSSITIGDISNMNGGVFSPHAGHRNGAEVDAWFSGYNARDAQTAATMIDLLNDATYGSRITTVYVTFQKTATDSFWNAIKNVTLADGRKAMDIIQVESGHETHFHWNITP